MNKDTLKFKNIFWLLWLKTVPLCLIRIIHSTHTPAYIKSKGILSQLQIILILLISHISSWSYQAVQIIEYSRKAQTQFTGRSHSIGAINFTAQDFNRLMQLRPFYFDIQINVSPWFAAQKTLASHVASFPHTGKLQQIISRCHSYTISLQFCRQRD